MIMCMCSNPLSCQIIYIIDFDIGQLHNNTHHEDLSWAIAIVEPALTLLQDNFLLEFKVCIYLYVSLFKSVLASIPTEQFQQQNNL